MNPELRIAEDQDLYLKIYEKGDVYFINDTNYLYRAHAGGISQNNNKGKSYDYFAQVVLAAMKREISPASTEKRFRKNIPIIRRFLLFWNISMEFGTGLKKISPLLYKNFSDNVRK
jgi:hypothetical protein